LTAQSSKEQGDANLKIFLGWVRLAMG
jgi:hypothetical protein